MFPQPKKYGQVVFAVVAVIFIYKDPERAARMVNDFIDVISRFANAL